MNLTDSGASPSVEPDVPVCTACILSCVLPPPTHPPLAPGNMMLFDKDGFIKHYATPEQVGQTLPACTFMLLPCLPPAAYCCLPPATCQVCTFCPLIMATCHLLPATWRLLRLPTFCSCLPPFACKAPASDM